MFGNYDAAFEYIVHIQDLRVRQLVSMVLRRFELLALHGTVPAGEIDLLFVVKGLEAAMQDTEKLKYILNGNSLLWPE